MARYFDITSLTNSIELDTQREGQAAFTVTNATPASIGGDALIVPRPGSEGIKFNVDRPTRHYPAGATESIAVGVSAPREVPAGSHGFQLRMVLSGGIPEEQFDDGPVVTFEVKEPDKPSGDAKIPAKKPFPWWIVAVVAAVIAVVVIGGIIAFVASRPPPTGTLVVITQVRNDDGRTATASDFNQHIIIGGENQADFAGADFPGVTRTVNAGQFQVTEDAFVFYNESFSADCAGVLAAGEVKTCTVFNDDFQIIFPLCPPFCVLTPIDEPPVIKQ